MCGRFLREWRRELFLINEIDIITQNFFKIAFNCFYQVREIKGMECQIPISWCLPQSKLFTVLKIDCFSLLQYNKHNLRLNVELCQA